MIEFTLAETMMVEMALQSFMAKDMSQSDRDICEKAFMKIELGAKGAEIREMLNAGSTILRDSTKRVLSTVN